MLTTLAPFDEATSPNHSRAQVSVVIPTKNRPDDLETTFLSLLDQTAPALEIIIVDQSATEESEARVRAAYSQAPLQVRGGMRLCYVRDENIQGASAARNRGVDLSSGNIVVFLDDDVVLETDFIRELVAAYASAPDVIGVSGVVTNYRKPGWPRRLLLAVFWRGPFHDERQPIYWNASRLRGTNPIRVRKFGSGGMSLRSAALREVRFDEALIGVPPGEDVDLCCHLPQPSTLVLAPRARYVHKATGVNRGREHWLKRDAEAMYYLFLRNWNHGLWNRLCFLWLNFGYLCLATAGSIRRRSFAPWRALHDGICAAVNHVSGSNTAQEGWKPIAGQDIDGWNDTLLPTGASLLQFPYWNEAYRRVGVKPAYLAWHEDGRPVAYVCVLPIGFGRLKVGLVMRGPVALRPDRPVPAKALSGLFQWAASEGCIFLRFTHSDSDLLDRIENAGVCQRLDAFPFHLDRSPAMQDLVIEQCPDDAQMLSGFDREARRKIKRATEVGYELRVGASSADLALVWDVFLKFFQRKRIRLNLPFERFLDVARMAEPHDCLRVYSAWMDGKPLEALMVFRDKSTALCPFAALDINALGKRASPSVLLHWFAMRDMYRMGAIHYNLGPATGSLMQFKQQFRPVQVTYPPPATVILNKPLYWLWSVVALPAFGILKPCAGWLMRHLHRQSFGGRADHGQVQEGQASREMNQLGRGRS